MKEETWIGAARWVRTVGHRAGWMLLVAIVGLLATFHFGYLQGAPRFWLWITASALGALAVTIPLAELWLFLPGETWLERFARRRREDQMRQDVFALGMTPEEYVSSLPASDRVGRQRAERALGLSGEDK